MNHALDDILFVELLDGDAAYELALLLAPEWPATVQPWDDYWIVAVDLPTEPSELALVLRAVERWATERGLWNVPFRLDGREYEMEIGTPSTPVAAA